MAIPGNIPSFKSMPAMRFVICRLFIYKKKLPYNTIVFFILFRCYLLVFFLFIIKTNGPSNFIIKKSCYLYVRLIRTSHSTYIITYIHNSFVGLVASVVLICKSLWIKASAK